MLDRVVIEGCLGVRSHDVNWVGAIWLWIMSILMLGLSAEVISGPKVGMRISNSWIAFAPKLTSPGP